MAALSLSIRAFDGQVTAEACAALSPPVRAGGPARRAGAPAAQDDPPEHWRSTARKSRPDGLGRTRLLRPVPRSTPSSCGPRSSGARSTGFKGISGHPGSAGMVGGILFGVALIVGVLAPVLDVTDVLDPIGAVDGPGAHALGLVQFEARPGRDALCPAHDGRVVARWASMRAGGPLSHGRPFALVENRSSRRWSRRRWG